MREIPLTRGKVALCDDGDFEFLSSFEWCSIFQHGRWYAQTTVWDAREKKAYKVKMHNLLMGIALGGKEWDHEEGEGGLDNRRSNLRLATGQENQWNTGSRGGSSRFKNVTWNKRKRKWAVMMTANRKAYSGGYHDDENAAARAANELMKRYHGEFARLNEIEE